MMISGQNIGECVLYVPHPLCRDEWHKTDSEALEVRSILITHFNLLMLFIIIPIHLLFQTDWIGDVVHV